MPFASSVGMKQGGRFPEKFFITFQTLDRLVVDVRDVQNCRQEDNFASSITFRAFALYRLKMSRKSQVRFILLKACFLFYSDNVTLPIPPWNSDFYRPLGLRNSFQSSFPNTHFKETVSIVQ